VKSIPLTQGYSTVVDDEDFDRLVAMGKWCYSDGYARKRDKTTRKTIKMHQVILGVKYPLEVDHRDQNRLNNTRRNLRPSTRRENQGNSPKRLIGKTSKFKGVSASRGVWRSQIRAGGRNTSIGHYASEIEAAEAYDCAARLHFGEFAATNFGIREGTRTP